MYALTVICCYSQRYMPFLVPNMYRIHFQPCTKNYRVLSVIEHRFLHGKPYSGTGEISDVDGLSARILVISALVFRWFCSRAKLRITETP